MNRLPVLFALAIGLLAMAGVVAHLVSDRGAVEGRFTGTVRLGFAMGLSGPGAQGGQEMLRAVRDYLDAVNAKGGLGGLKLDLVVHDDGNDPGRAALAARAMSADPTVLAVIGHNYSTASAAAAPIYGAAGLVAVTPASTSPGLDRLADGWLFRTIYDDDQQGEFLVSYAQQALAAPQVALVVAPDVYGDRLAGVIRATAARRQLPVAAEWRAPVDDATALARLVATLAELPGDTVVMLLAHQAPAVQVVRALREAGLTHRLLGPDALGSVGFAARFAALPREELDPGFYANGLFVSVPFLPDTANAEARALIGRLEADGTPLATWGAPYAYDAAKVIVEAMRRAGIGVEPLDGRSRGAIRDQLLRMRQRGLGVQGATGVTWFNADGSARKPVTIGQFAGRLISSLRQLRYEGVDGEEATLELPVVYAGILPRRISRVGDAYDVEADVWFRFQGDVPIDDMVVTGAVERLELGPPVETAEVGGIVYRRYHLAGRLRATADGIQAARARHSIAIGLHHRWLPDTRMLIVPDSLALPEVRGPGFARLLRTRAILPRGEDVTAASFGPDTVERSTLGNPLSWSRGATSVRLPGVLLALELGPERPDLRRAWLDGAVEPLALACAGLLIALLLLDGRAPLARAPQFSLLLIGLVAGATLVAGESAAIRLLMAMGADHAVSAVILTVDLAWWIVAAAVAMVAVHRFLWAPLERAAARPVPRIIKIAAGALVILLAGFGVVGNVLGHNVTGLLATSGIMVAIIGLALQSSLSSLFAGIALNLERPIRPGDWVKIGDATVAQVVDISWRSTRLKTFANTSLTIPNAAVATARIENFTYPEERYFIFQILYFDPVHDPEVLTDLLTDALRLAPSVDGRDRLGLIWIKFNGVDERGSRFLVAFDCTDRLLMNSQEHKVLISVHHTLRAAGISLATRRTDMHVHRTPDERLRPSPPIEELIDDVALFRSLSTDVRGRLAVGARRRVFAAGEMIVTQGEVGDSLFLVAEGVVCVLIAVDDGSVKEVARLGRGAFFGEMALLTGEPRGSGVKALGHVVLYEIDKSAVAPILDENPDLMARLSDIMASRQLTNDKLSHAAVRYEDAHRTLSARILGRVMSFFGGGAK
jgi:branched-chain amino acid transport system substrate-binding protein